MQRVYKIFLSCEEDLILGNEPIKELIENRLRETEGVNLEIKCFKSFKNVNSASQRQKCVKKRCVYVIDTHSCLNNTAYWQLGYAMGKDMEIIGYYAGENKDKAISDDVDQLTRSKHSTDDQDFFELIRTHIADKMGVSVSNWNKVGGVTEEEIGGA